MQRQEPAPALPEQPALASSAATPPQPATPSLLTVRYPFRFNLDNLRGGPDVLNPHGIQTISRITLRELEVALPGAFHPAIIIKADDIFAGGLAHGPCYCAIPEGSIPIRAVLDVLFVGSPDPHTIELRPPNIIILNQSAEALSVSQWIIEALLRAGQKLAHALTILILAFACAACSLFGDGDGDDDDLDSDRPHPAFLMRA